MMIFRNCMSIAIGISTMQIVQHLIDRQSRKLIASRFSLVFVIVSIRAFVVYIIDEQIPEKPPTEWTPSESDFFHKIGVASKYEMLILTLLLLFWTTLHHTRALFELVVEWCVRPWLYRIRWTGPGTSTVPIVGPCLVIANHGSWPDPVFLGIALPRPMTPIMIQSFYDMWFLRPILKYIFRAIVVPETPIRRETPELEQAVAALQRGELVVIYPEGYLRRKEDQPLKRFGQGVWRILQACPDVPVVPCWIEGAWGSNFSHAGGPPGAKGKKMDFFRRITIRMMPPLVVPPEVLAEGMATRLYLMNRVIDAHNSGAATPLPHVTAASGESTEA